MIKTYSHWHKEVKVQADIILTSWEKILLLASVNYFIHKQPTYSSPYLIVPPQELTLTGLVQAIEQGQQKG